MEVGGSILIVSRALAIVPGESTGFHTCMNLRILWLNIAVYCFEFTGWHS
eukprot:COSAG01_NODE_1160_length_11460_cov_196.773611_1_plen_50_part_00